MDALHYAIGCPLALGLDAGGVGVVLAMRFWFVARWPDFERRGYGRAEGEGEEEGSPGDACDEVDWEVGAGLAKGVVGHANERDQSSRKYRRLNAKKSTWV